MKVRTLLAGALAAAALAAGCVTLSPAELQATEGARTQAEQVLVAFADALNQRDVEVLKSVLSPYLKPADVQQLGVKLVSAGSLTFYEGYAPDFKAALAKVRLKQWQSGLVLVDVPYANRYGETTTDKFALHNRDNRWSLVDFQLKDMQPGETLNPPDDVKKVLLGKAGDLLGKLKAGSFMEVYYAIPPAFQRRYIERTWWEKATQDKPDAIDVLNDLERVTQDFTVLNWPKPEAGTFVYAAGSGVGVLYEVPYVWPRGGIVQTDILSLQFIFLRTGEGWMFYQLIMKAVGIPWSQ